MEQLLNLPTPVKAVLALLTGTSIVGAVALIADPKLAGIVALGLVLLALAVAVFIFIRAQLRKRKATSMAAELSQHSSSSPAGVSDAARRARLDDMRRSFAEGITKFGSADNIYKFPWYLIVGEPGSGKTEAIRHSNVGFPPGLQNELQGVGGTINMNWWFTNQAVFLDTAGRLMFEEVRAGETNEWKEFLQLLLRNRPNCPVNGLLLIIPTDALIKDSEAKLNEKAGKIAAQFDLIQRTLDIRFPVFVTITKCDMLGGFREFFDDFADATSVNQMLGWSNPDDRDAPFQPDRVTDHLATVVQRIKKRRLSLLRDPVPSKGEERRADEVDALYSLPQSIQLIAPRLRQYLEKIFVAGPWSPKPLFLRGIYFTSSMREGAALDQELALALGLSADQLSEAKVWEKERAYFLRDIFTEKVFRERGLVTRATDTKKMLRKRGLLLWGTATALALGFVGFTLYAYDQFKTSIGGHSRLWEPAKERWSNGKWNPIVKAAKEGDTAMLFQGNDLVAGKKLLEYHEQLRNEGATAVQTSWVYRPLGELTIPTKRLRNAQRIVYEGSVVYPLVMGARNRMLNEKVGNAKDFDSPVDARLVRETAALNALLRIEADKVSLSPNRQDIPEAVLLPLLAYDTAGNPQPDDKQRQLLGQTFLATYTGPDAAKWVPERLAYGADSLAQNPPIQAGLARLRALSGESIRSQLESAAKITKMRDDLREFRRIEREMEATATGPGETKQKEEKLTSLLAQLTTVKTAFDEKLKAAKADKIVAGDTMTLGGAYQQLVTASQSQSSGNLQSLRDAVKPHVEHPIAKLFKEVDDELAKTSASLSEQVKSTFSAKDVEELAQLDTYLEDFGDSRRIYEVRFATYRDASEIANRTDKLDDLIGKSWAPYSNVAKEIDGIRGQLPKLQIKLASGAAKDNPSVDAATNALLKVAEEKRLGAIASAYIDQTRQKLESGFFEPMVSESGGKPMSSASRKDAEALVEKWKLDLASPDFQKLDPTAKTKLALLGADFDAMKAAAAAYDQYVKKFQDLRVSIRLTGPGQYKWHIVEGGGSRANIFKGESFSTTVKYGGTVGIKLTDPVNGRSGGGAIDTQRPGTQSISQGGDTLQFVVALVGEVPQPPPPGPKKANVLQKLR